MIIKYLMLVLPLIGINTKENALNSQNIMSDFIKRTIRAEVSAIGFKLLIGIVVISTIIFSIIQVGQLTQNLLKPLENGSIIELVIFSVVVVLGSLILYFLFKNRQTNSISQKNEAQFSSSAVDLRSLGIKFAEGIMEGFESSSTKTKGESFEK